jgi:dTDP-4-amino-4,6-dideoxygalactose transaminase
MFDLQQELTAALGRSYCVLCGRGTTALWLALRAIRRRDGPGEVIIPDILCASVLEGVVLAGFQPVFADVLPSRYTLAPDSVTQLITPRTRAVLVAHLYGHIAEVDVIRETAPGIPIIEDAVQGFGGSFGEQPVGSLGDISFISFDSNKMIGGRGGAVLFDDETLLDGIQADLDRLPDLPDLSFETLDTLLPPPAAAAYAHHLRSFLAPTLLCKFNRSPANLDRIQTDWKTLSARVEARNEKTRWLGTQLAGLPVRFPELRAGDAIWCYTLTAPSVIFARRILRDLHKAGLNGSGLYRPLSHLFGQQSGAGRLADCLVNLWAAETTSDAILQRTVDVIAAVPSIPTVPASS